MSEKIDEKALMEERANYCLSCPKPLCEDACPVHNHIRDFIRMLKQNDLNNAGIFLHGTNPFPEFTCKLCDSKRQCQGACVRGKAGAPVEIPWLEGYIAAHAERDRTLKPSNNHDIAIVGTGIAGLTAGRILLMEGFAVDFYEKEQSIGGAIYTGIPEYRFDKSVLAKVQAELEEMGAKFHFGVEVGRSITIDNILAFHDRLIVAIGASQERLQNLEASEGYVGGLSLLYDLNVKKEAEKYQEKYQNAFVWGGGNVALDCARSLKRILPNVSIIYRRGEEQMPANKDEIEDAKKEGIEFHFLENILSLEKDLNGKLVGARCIKMELGPEDQSGRASFKEIENSEFSIDCDLIVAATGQAVDTEALKPGLIHSWRNQNHEASQDRIYFAGDCFLGPKTVVHCIQDGKDVAQEIIASF
ncbi:MAG: FAD-dependent oxidoreductase [Bacilli bacterium]|nr:FAD-dependent oxidoreductase [Bacilli bacterium]